MTADEVLNIALKAIGGIGGLVLIVGVLWKQFLSEAATNKKKVAQTYESRMVVVEQRTQGISDAYKGEIALLRERVAVLEALEERRPRTPQSYALSSDGPTVMNYPNPVAKKRVTKSLPAAQPAPEPGANNEEEEPDGD